MADIEIAPNIKGDITQCKIENVLIKTQINSVWSYKRLDTKATYDVCNKQILEMWDEPSFTGIAAIYLVVGPILLWVVLAILASTIFRRWCWND